MHPAGHGSTPPSHVNAGTAVAASRPAVQADATGVALARTPPSNLLLSNCQEHSIMFCTANLPADEKPVRLRNNNCCFRCGIRNPNSRACKNANSLTCGSCHRRHLTILCDLSRPVVQDSLTAAEFIALGRPPSSRLQTITTAKSKLIGRTAVVLPTGRIRAKSGNRRLLVQVLLDSGSQRSYIRADMARILQCSLIGREELSIMTFGSSNAQKRLCADHVSVRLRSQFSDAEVQLEALAIPEICSVTSPLLEHHTLQTLLEKKYHVAAAWQSTTWQEGDITVLLAPDAYRKVTTSKIDHINETLRAIETTFEWMLQGHLLWELMYPYSAQFVLISNPSPPDIDVTLMWRLDSIVIDGSYSQPLEINAHLTTLERYITKQGRRSQVPLMVEQPGLPAGNSNVRLAEQQLQH
ncbi:hypothetical protein HPB51_009665 [Rhipicephalus microplus]|uniref:Peptidase aspartic putative domain-containing protein n=1 Tax=Rhipicephalus microplus TaxID=6941 RepID=A0A9J6DZR5_RHIMP|nr:hypothetical protein HPB51_009665 [Rhipicephalus microplus]